MADGPVQSIRRMRTLVSTGATQVPFQDASGSTNANNWADQVALNGGNAYDYLFIQNTDATHTLAVNYTGNAGTAGAPDPTAIQLGPGQSLEFKTVIPTNDIHVASSISAHTFVLKYA